LQALISLLFNLFYVYDKSSTCIGCAVMARPFEITHEICAAIIEDVADAIPYEYAAEGNGISERTLYHWLAQGKIDRDAGLDTIFSQLLHGVKRAERSRIRHHIGNIDNGSETWTCDAWMLERRWWKHYSKSAPVLDFEIRLKKMEEESANNKPAQDEKAA
jgi:hypothetical protein